MKDEKFYKEVDLMFEDYLTLNKSDIIIRIKDIAQNKILTEKDMNYSKVLFDSELNLYKKDKDGNWVKVEDKNFKALLFKS